MLKTTEETELTMPSDFRWHSFLVSAGYLPDTYEYDHDCPFEAFITNLGKYNEGVLVGEWVKFPTTAEELQKVFERIGIGSKDDFGHPYEEWFITDYRIMNDAT